MKRYLILIITIISLSFCSWTIAKTNMLNSNSWGISIGKKDILASWKNNKMGDFASLSKKNLKLSDTLFVQRYLCGYDGNNSITTLTIKNSRNEIIKESVNKNNYMIFKAKMPLSDFLDSATINNKQILLVYFTIFSKIENLNQTVLLGRLKFK